MFDNIGRKIKTLASVLAWIGIVLSIIYGLILLADGKDDNVVVGVIIIVVGSLCSWLSSFVLYGFGQLIENSDILVDQNGILISQGKKQVATPATTDTTQKQTDAPLPVKSSPLPQTDTSNSTVKHRVRCTTCGNMVNCDENFCRTCGAAIKGNNP